MISYSNTITKDVWVKIVDDGEEFMLQHKGKNRKLLVKASTGAPTDSLGAFELSPTDVVASTILTGEIWVRALSEDVLIAYAK